MIMGYWWAVCDTATYKGPNTIGRAVLATDLISPGYILDTADLAYSFEQGDLRKIGDFSFWGGGCFFVNDRAFRVMKVMFLRHGKVYPVACNGMQYFIVVIDVVLDALSIEQSVYERFGLYPNVSDDIDRLRQIVLKDDFETEADIFRLEGNATVAMEVLVSDRFQKLYKESNLTGLVFKPTSAK